MKKPIFCLILGGVLFFAFNSISQAPEDKSFQKEKASKDFAIQSFALMEIFTSEGCSNCPPAYKVVDKVIEKANKYQVQVILLDFHVDYFNDPWVDPYSSAANTERQEHYAKIFPKAGVYTPQMIVNGSQALLASDTKRVHTAIDKALNTRQTSRLIIKSAVSDQYMVKVDFTTENIPGDSMICVALVQTTAVQKVLGGENAGATLTHHNVVRSLQHVKAKVGTISIPVPITSVDKTTKYQVIAFRQILPTMKIIAAAQKEVSN